MANTLILSEIKPYVPEKFYKMLEQTCDKECFTQITSPRGLSVIYQGRIFNLMMGLSHSKSAEIHRLTLRILIDREGIWGCQFFHARRVWFKRINLRNDRLQYSAEKISVHRFNIPDTNFRDLSTLFNCLPSTHQLSFKFNRISPTLKINLRDFFGDDLLPKD